MPFVTIITIFIISRLFMDQFWSFKNHFVQKSVTNKTYPFIFMLEIRFAPPKNAHPRTFLVHTSQHYHTEGPTKTNSKGITFICLVFLSKMIFVSQKSVHKQRRNGSLNTKNINISARTEKE